MLGKEMRAARLAAELTQEQLAARARFDRSYISQLERNLKSPTVDTLNRLCAVLGIFAATLLSRVEARGRSK